MPDANKKVQIDIVTVASGDGAKQTSASLNDLSEQTKKYIKSLENAQEKGEKFELTHREIHMLTRQLIPGFGEFGHVLTSMANPMVGLTLAMGAVVGKMYEIGKEMDELTNMQTPDWTTQSEKLNALKTAYEQAEQSLASYERELSRAANRTDGPEQIAEKRIAALKHQQSAEMQYLEATKRLQETAVEEAEHHNIISHEQATQQKLQIEEAFARRRMELENEVQQNEIRQRQYQLQSDVYRQHVLSTQLPGASEKAAGAQGAVEHNKAFIEENKANLEKALEFQKQLQEKIADAQTTIQKYSNPLSLLVPGLNDSVARAEKALPVAEGQAASVAAQIAMFRANIAKGEGAGPGLANAAASSKEELEALKTALREATVEINKLNLEIPQMQQAAGLDAKTRSSVFGADSLGRATKFVDSLTPDQLATAGAGMDALQHGGKVDAATRELIKSLSSVLATSHANIQDVISIIKQGNQGQAGVKSEIDALKRTVRELYQRFSSSSYLPPPNGM